MTCWSSSRPGTSPGTWPVWVPSPPTPGDVLYLPAHTDHSAEAQGEVSLHITIGILRVTYGHVVRRLLDRLDGVDLDAPLPLGFAVARPLRRAARRAHPPPRGGGRGRAGADRRARRRAARATPGDPLALAAPARAAPVDPGARQDRARRRWWRRGPITRPSSSTSRRWPGRAACSSIARWRCRRRRERRSSTCFDGEDTKVGELPDLSDASRMVLVRRLVREGWLRVVRSLTRPGRAPMLARWARTSAARSSCPTRRSPPSSSRAAPPRWPRSARTACPTSWPCGTA